MSKTDSVTLSESDVKQLCKWAVEYHDHRKAWADLKAKIFALLPDSSYQTLDNVWTEYMLHPLTETAKQLKPHAWRQTLSAWWRAWVDLSRERVEQKRKRGGKHDKGNGVDGGRQYLVYIVRKGGETDDEWKCGLLSYVTAMAQQGVLWQKYMDEVKDEVKKIVENRKG